MAANNIPKQVFGANTAANPEPKAGAFRKNGRKAPGTRNGTAIDWREGSAAGGKISIRHGHTIRDGR